MQCIHHTDVTVGISSQSEESIVEGGHVEVCVSKDKETAVNVEFNLEILNGGKYVFYVRKWTFYNMIAIITR